MNPIAIREFYGSLRMRRALAAVVVLAFSFSLMVLARWPSDGVVDLSGAQSRQVFRIFAYGLLGGVLLLVPAFPATTIVREKIKGTLELLLNSPMGPVSIYFGKFSGMLLFVVLLMLTSLPAAAACFAMGGLDLQNDLGLTYWTLLLVTVECTAIGLLVSVMAQKPDSAVRITYGVILAIVFVTPGPYFLLQGQTGTAVTIATWFRHLSPLPVLMHLVGDSAVMGQGLEESKSGLIEFTLLSLLVTLIAGFMTILQLNHRLFDRARSQGKITEDQSLPFRIVRRLIFLVDPQRRKPGIPFFMNPVMVKEFRTRRFGRLHWLLRLVAACAMVSLLLTLAATTGTFDWGVETIGGMLVVLQVLLIVTITPSLAAGLISSERESGGWDLLRMTRISGFRIVLGKLASVMWTLLLVLLATAPGYLVMIYIKPSMWLQVEYVMGCLLLTAIYCLAISSTVGSLFVRTATSTIAVYIVLMILFLGPLLIWMGRDAPFGFTVVRTALAINPMGAALSIIRMPGFESYSLIPLSWQVSLFISVSALSAFWFRTWRLMCPL